MKKNKTYKTSIKPNVLIRNNMKFENIAECRILFAMFARIGKIENPEDEFSIDYSEITSEVSTFKFSSIQNACKSLMQRVVDLEDCEGSQSLLISLKKRMPLEEKFKYVGIASSIKHQAGTNTIEITFNKKIYELLNTFYVKGGYTRFVLKHILPIKSIYTLRIYEILKQCSYKKVFEINFIALKVMIGANIKYYESYSVFERSVLSSAKKSIEKYTDIKFSYEEIYELKKIVGVKFVISENVFITNKTESEIKAIDDEIKANRIEYKKKIYDESAVHVKAIRENIWPKDQERVLDSNSKLKIMYYLELAKEAQKRGGIDDFKGYFFKVLQNDYDNFEEKLKEKLALEDQKRKEEQAKKRLQREKERQEEEKFRKQEEIFESYSLEVKNVLLSLEPKFFTPEQKRSAAISKITLE
jgi:plasmid replication initiation protein